MTMEGVDARGMVPEDSEADLKYTVGMCASGSFKKVSGLPSKSKMKVPGCVQAYIRRAVDMIKHPELQEE